MPEERKWSGPKRTDHDRKLRAAGREGREAIAIAKDLRDTLAKMDTLAEGVVNAVLGSRKRATRGRGLQLHEIISNLHERGLEILNAGPQDLTGSQRRNHHDGVRSISSLLERSAKDAAELSKRLSEIRKGFEAIQRLYK